MTIWDIGIGRYAVITIVKDKVNITIGRNSFIHIVLPWAHGWEELQLFLGIGYEKIWIDLNESYIQFKNQTVDH